MINKKGMFATLGLTLFVLVLLSLSLLFVKQANFAETRNVELSFFQRIDDLSSSVGKTFSDQINAETGMVLSMGNDSITITENFPAELSELDTKLVDLENKIETDFTNLELDLTNYLTSYAVIFQPLNVRRELSVNTLTLISNSNVQSYDYTLTFFSNVSSCNNNLLATGTKSLNLVVVSSGTGGCTINQVNAEGTVIINSDSGAVTLQMLNNGQLSINGNVLLKSNLKINFLSDDSGHFELPITLQITEAVYDFTKTSNLEPYFSFY